MRAIWLHCQAIDAEKEGRFEHADFLYQELDRDLRRLERRKAWQQMAPLALDPAAAARLDANALRRAALDELLIDSHIALFNAHVAVGANMTTADRAWRHLNRSEALRKLTIPQSVSPPDAFELSLNRAKLAILEASNEWERVTAILGEHLARSSVPNAVIVRAAEARFGQYGRELKSAHTDTARMNAAERFVSDIAANARKWPDHQFFHELLGIGYRQLAIARANGGRLSESLADIQRAIDHNPWQDGLNETARQLEDAMTQLRERMGEVEAQLAAQPYASLTSEGEAMRAEARSGYSKLEAYRNGSERASIPEARRRAQAASLWRRLGLEPLTATNAGKPLALLSLIEATAQAAEGRAATLADVESAALAHPLPGGVQHDTIVRFLADPSQFQAAPPDPFPAGAVENAPVADPMPANLAARPGIPARQWLRSHQSRGWRIAAALGALAAVGAAGAFAMDFQQRAAKTEHFEALTAAWMRTDEAAARTAIARYRGVRTMAALEERDSVVREIESRLDELPRIRQRNAAYEALLRAVAAEQHAAALDAAEAYLKVPKGRDPDQRLRGVKDHYAQALVRWLTTASGTSDAIVESRLQVYQRLVRSESAGR